MKKYINFLFFTPFSYNFIIFLILQKAVITHRSFLLAWMEIVSNLIKDVTGTWTALMVRMKVAVSIFSFIYLN